MTLESISDRRLRYSFALCSGLITALACAAAWALATSLTGYHLGWIPIAIGFLVGMAVHLFGGGAGGARDGITGSALALTGSLLGGALSACVILAEKQGVPFFEYLSSLNVESFEAMKPLMFSGFDPIFFLVAAFEGYKISRAKSA